MATKIVANLLMLSRHPGAPSNFRAVAANLHPMWMRLLQQSPDQPLRQPPQGQALAPRPDSDIHRVLWHTTPETLQ